MGAAIAALSISLSGRPSTMGPAIMGRRKAAKPQTPPPNPKAEYRKMLKVRAMQERKDRKRMGL